MQVAYQSADEVVQHIASNSRIFVPGIIAMTSTTHRGESKIVPFLKNGAGVVTTRAHVHFVVTEYEVVNLFGKNLKQRAMELMKIAHPRHREWLEKEIIQRFCA